MPDITFTTVGSLQERLVDIGDDTFAEVTAQPILMPAAWRPPSTFNGRVYPDSKIQIIGTPTTAYTFQDSFDGVSFNDCNAWDRNGLALTSITSADRYRLPGSFFLKARQGAGATIMIRAGS